MTPPKPQEMLKNCPFCGSSDIDPEGCASFKPEFRTQDMNWDEHATPERIEHRPSCNNCNATTDGDWNTRTPGSDAVGDASQEDPLLLEVLNFIELARSLKIRASGDAQLNRSIERRELREKADTLYKKLEAVRWGTKQATPEPVGDVPDALKNLDWNRDLNIVKMSLQRNHFQDLNDDELDTLIKRVERVQEYFKAALSQTKE